MKIQRFLHLFTSVVVAFAMVGCANPADNKPAAKVSDPVNVPAAIPGASENADARPLAAESTMEWIGSKVTGSHDGGFKSLSGTIALDDDNLASAQITIEIDIRSLWSDTTRLTGHLMSKDFFEAETFPAATFTSTSVEKGETGYTVAGILDLHGITKSISFPAELALDNDRVTLDAEFSINRTDFGINYAGKIDDLIRDEVVVKLALKTE